MTDYHLTIGSQPVTTSRYFDVKNPSNGELVGRAPQAGKGELDLAVAAAAEAFKTWSIQSDTELQAACEKVTAVIAGASEELAHLITLEQGKPLNGLGSRWEMGGAAAWAGYTAGLSLKTEVLQDADEGRVELCRKPLGVVGSITPWNFPVMIAIWHILPALRTGNTVVIKPSPNTPLSTLKLIELIDQVLPAGVINVLTSDDDGENLGAMMAAHPDIRKIVFTGSCATGQKVMRSASETMKRLTLEMGGNDAGIVLPDVDPAAIAEGLFWGAFINNGQTCAALKRLYVHEDVHDAVCEALVAYARNIPVGDGMNDDSALGPIQNQMQFDRFAGFVAAAKVKGNVLLGGEPGIGLFFPPTIISGLSNDDDLVSQEQFGPALPVIKYADLEDAIALANDSDNGLGGSVWSSDVVKAREVASRLECGSVWINKHGAIQPNAPFAGTKSSGLGVEFGQEGLHEFTDIQVVFS
jgi:acyl-CoA reductase-like NAD-dependent aldehyde dehydrogenase